MIAPDLSAGVCIGDSYPWHSTNTDDITFAINGCNRCVVREACLEFTLTWEAETAGGQRHGVAGGLTPTQRARRPVTPVVSIEHGTDLGYRQHHRAGTPACPSCIEGNAVVRRARKARKAVA